MTVRILRSADRPPTPWKNVGGITREVAAEPPGADPDGFGWRVSFADVARGVPFSAYPGVDRVITLISGHGMVLTVEGTPFAMTEPYVPFAFSGGDTVTCRLVEGPVVALNVMTRRGMYTTTVRITSRRRVLSSEADADAEEGGVTASSALEPSASMADAPAPVAATLVIALSGPATLRWPESEAGQPEREPITLGANDAALLSPHDEPVTVEPSALAAVVSFSPTRLLG